MKEQRPSRPRGRQPPTFWPRKALILAQGTGRPTPEELQPDAGFQAAFAMVPEQEAAHHLHQGTATELFRRMMDEIFPTFARPP